MPLPKPLPALQEDLRHMLTEDLAGALKMLLQLLPPGSEKHQTATTLAGKLNDTNKARLRGTIANGDLQLAYNQLRSDLLDLVDDLEDADFDAAPALAESKKAKQGEILYRIPGTMPLGRETRCLVRIALDADAIVENITLDEHVTLKSILRVSDLMQVELVDPSGEPTFQIRSINSPEQMVEDTGYTEWLFWVTPLRTGTFPLMIKVSVIELLLGKERKKEIVLEEIIRISADAPETPADAPLKPAGEALVFSSTAAPEPTVRAPETAPPQPAPAAPPAAGSAIPLPTEIYRPPIFQQEQAPVQRPAGRRGMRTAALFFVFLAVSAGTTWAVAPHEAAWVWTRYVQDSPEAYSTYAEKYPKSRHREKALFRRATLTNRATDLQIYLKEYPRGRFIESVRVRLDTLERRDFDSLRRKPDATRILEFIRRYPNSSRLEAVQQVLDTSRTLPREQLREELKQWIEKRETILQPYEDERFLQLSGQNQSGKTNTYSLDTPDMVSGKPSGHKQRILFRPNLMVFVKGGTFSMGNVFDEYPGTEEGPVHRVTLSSFFIGQTEVTFDEYDAYCIATGVEKPYDAGWGRGRLPVIYVSWFDAIEYCNWLSEQRGLEKVYSIDGLKVTANWTADGYRLPTEAEWEFAARERGRKVRFGNGKDIADPEEINFSTDLIKESYSQEGIDRERTVPVGSLNSPNSLGLHDMSGNVEEWCWDLAYYYQAGAQRDPRDIEHYSSTRVLRGGSWCVGPSSVRTPRRGYNDPVWSSSFIGFRIARTAKAGER